MSSWGPGFAQAKGHRNLSHYHHVGFECFATEYFKLIRSLMYTQNLNEFLFVYDKINSVSVSIGLFDHTLKKNEFIRFLPYFPTSGFNIADRNDLLQDAFQRRALIPNVPTFFTLFRTVFSLQSTIKDHITSLYLKNEIPIYLEERIGVCLQEGLDFSLYLTKLKSYLSEHNRLTLFLVGPRSLCEEFKSQIPTEWTVQSMWDTVPSNIVTEEQKMDVFHASLGVFVCLEHSKLVVGSFRHPVFRFMYCKESRFRDPSQGVVVDDSSFSFF